MTTTRKTTDPAAIPAIIATFDGVVGGAVSTVMLNMTWRVFVSSFGFREEMMEKMYWPWSEWTTWNNVIICFKLKCIKALSPKPVKIYTCTPIVITMFTSQYASACCVWFYCRVTLLMPKQTQRPLQFEKSTNGKLFLNQWRSFRFYRKQSSSQWNMIELPLPFKR